MVLKYKILKSIFQHPLSQWLFSKIHPDWGISLAYLWSKKSRKKGGQINKEKLKQDLLEYAKKILTNTDINYFIFGHIHDPIEIELTPSSKYINLGDWITHFSFLEFHNRTLLFKYF